MRKAHDFVLSDKAGRESRQFLPWPFLVAPTQVNAKALLREVHAAEEGWDAGVGVVRFYVHRLHFVPRLPLSQGLLDLFLEEPPRGHRVRLKQEAVQLPAEVRQHQPLPWLSQQNDLDRLSDVFRSSRPGPPAIGSQLHWKADSSTEDLPFVRSPTRLAAARCTPGSGSLSRVDSC